MHASLIAGPLRPDQLGEATRLYRERIIPTARREFRGYQGLYVMVDPTSGEGLTIGLYDSEADARQVESSGQFAQAVATLRALLTGPPSREVREVVFHDRRGAPRYARVTEGTLPPDQIPAEGGGAMAEAAARQPGYAGFLITADRASGRTTGMSFWEALEALEASDRAYYQPQVGQLTSSSPLRRRVFEVMAHD
jgi:hypothetical protein